MTEHNLIVWTLVPHRLLYLRGVFFSQFLVRCVRWGGVCYTEATMQNTSLGVLHVQ